jgi:hypothetical protein
VWAVDELYERTSPEERIEEALPPRLKILAAPASSALRQAAYEGADKAIASPRVEEAWVKANTRAHERFVRVVEGEDPIIVESGVGVVLDIRPILERIATRVGIDPSFVNKIPARFSQLRPQRSEQFKRTIDTLNVLNTYGPWIGYAGVAFLIGGIALGQGTRRKLVFRFGLGLVLMGLVMGIIREESGPYLAQVIAGDATTWHAAIQGTWDAVSLQLELAGRAMILVGVFAALGAWVGGGTRPALAIRRVIGPVAANYLGVSTVALVVLIGWVMTSAPAFASRPPSTRVILTVLALAGGIALLRELGRGYKKLADESESAASA